MKVEFELEKENYTIPNKLVIGKYVKIFKLKDIVEDEYFSLKLISELSGAPVDLLQKVNYNEINYLTNYCLTLFPNSNNFVDRFELNGVKYGFIPDWKKMSFAEWVDLDTLFTKKEKEVMDYIHIITAIMYRPIISENGNKYEIEDYNSDKMIDRSELFKNELDIKFYIGASFFLSQFVNRFLNPSHRFSTMTTMQKIKMLFKHRKMITEILLQEDSVGLYSSTRSPTTTLPNTKLCSKNPLSKSLIKLRILWHLIVKKNL